MSPKVKKIIAREWLIFLLILLLTPSVIAVYNWVRAPRLPGVMEIPADYKMYEPVVDNSAFVMDDVHVGEIPIQAFGEKATKFHDAIEKLKNGNPFFDKSVVTEAMEKDWLTFRKRRFGIYFLSLVQDLDNYVLGILFYPLYLFIRSIVWSVRTLRGKEA